MGIDFVEISMFAFLCESVEVPYYNRLDGTHSTDLFLVACGG